MFCPNILTKIPIHSTDLCLILISSLLICRLFVWKFYIQFLFCAIIMSRNMIGLRALKSIWQTAAVVVSSRNRRYRVWLDASKYVIGCHCPNIVVVWFECPPPLFWGHFSSRLPIKLKIVWKYELITCTEEENICRHYFNIILLSWFRQL